MSTIKNPARFKRRWIAAGVTLALVCVGTVYALTSRKDTPAAQKDTQPAAMELVASDILRADPQPYQPMVTLAGTLAPIKQAQLNAPFEGRMGEVAVRAGDAVRAGQVLAHFDEGDLRARRAERAAALASAEENMRVAERNRASSRALLDQNFISKNAFDNTLGGFAERQAAVDAQRAQLAIVERALRDARVVAPFAGQVAERQVDPGQWVEGNRRLFTVIDLATLEAEATVPSQHVAKLAPGQKVRIRVEGFGDEVFEGTLARINPSAQPGTRSVLAYVTVPNPGERLKAGLYVSGEIATAAPVPEIQLPVTAIQATPQGRGVWAVVAGRLSWRAVEFERLSADTVRVTRGLAGGESVIAVPLKGAREQLAIRVKTAG